MGSNYLNASQMRGARGILDWSQNDLASASNLSIATIRKLEVGNISPRGKTNELIRQAFEDAGLEFIDPDGVRRRPDDLAVHEGIAGVKNFYEDVFQTLDRKGGLTVSVSPNPNAYFDLLADRAKYFHERMMTIKGLDARCIITGDPSQRLPAPGYCEYRAISKSYVDSISYFVYGEKAAVRAIDVNSPPKIVVIQSPLVVQSFIGQFYSMWDKATPINRIEKADKRGNIKK